MATEIVMPKMGYDMTEGKLLRWFKHEGDTVARGEAVAEIETDKVAIEVETFEAGMLRRVLVQEGETVPVGTRLALVAAPDEDLAVLEQSIPAQASGPAPAGTPGSTQAAASPPRPITEQGS